MKLLHGEQYFEIKKPIPSSGKFVSSSRIVDILDKGKGASLIIGVVTKDEDGEGVAGIRVGERQQHHREMRCKSTVASGDDINLHLKAPRHRRKSADPTSAPRSIR